jgi:excinuclease UvrABC helicase subunit UvrB
MYGGETEKKNLVNMVLDFPAFLAMNRPLKFEEFETMQTKVIVSTA